MILRDLLRRPLEQAMALLWLVTLVHLFNRAVSDQWSFSWSVSAALAGLLALLLIGRYQLARLISVPIVLALAACLALLSQLGLQTDALALSAVWFALLLWWFCRKTLESPTLRRLRDVLRLQLDDGDIAVEHILMITHVTLFAIAGCALAVQLSQAALFDAAADHSWIVLLTGLSVLSIQCLSQERYADPLNSYLMLILSVISVMEFLSLTLHPFTFPTLSSDPYSGLLFVALASLMMFVASRLKNLPDFDQDLYVNPIRVTATVSALLAVVMQLYFFLAIEQARVSGLDVFVLFSAGMLLMIRNQTLHWPYLSTIAIALLLMASLWLIFAILHPGAAFSLWLGPSAFVDQWISLALLTLLLSSFSQYFENKGFRFSRYCASLNAVVNAAYVWCLLGMLQFVVRDPVAESALLPWLLALLLIGQLPVLRHWPYAAQIRGVGVIALLLMLLWSLLFVSDHIDGIRHQWAFTAFIFWYVASKGLPKWNRRYPTWAISPVLWPWIGLLLLVTALLSGGPVWITEWPWLMLLVVYLLLMDKAYLDLPALLLAVLSLLWLQSVLLHPASFSLWPRFDTAADIWFTLSAAALLFSLLSGSDRVCGRRFRGPVQQAGLICFSWALIGAIVLFIADADHVLMPWIALMLLLGLFSLSGFWPHGERLRGIGGGVLLTLIVVSCVRQLQLSLLQGLVLHSYLLWWASYRWIPRFNRAYPSLALEAQSWAWLGLPLMFVAGSMLEGFAKPGTLGYLLALCGYCVLMLRYTDKSLLSWMAAFFFTLVGPAIAALCWPGIRDDINGLTFSTISFVLLLWLNFQVGLAHLGRRYRKILKKRTWLSMDLSRALLFFADLFLYGALLVYASYVFVFSELHSVVFGENMRLYVLAIGLLLALTFVNVLSYAFRPLRLHGLVLAGFSLAWAIYFAFPVSFLHPPLYLSLCCLMLAAAYHWVKTTRLRRQTPIERVLSAWLRFLLIVATFALLFNLDYSLQAFLVNLVVVVVITAFYGLWTLSWNWFATACLELMVLLHGWPFLWLSLSELDRLYPWYALQAAFLAWLFLLLIQRRQPPEQIRDLSEGRMAMTHLVLHYWPWLIAVSLVELLMHIVQLRHWLMMSGEVLGLMPPLDSFAALAAGLIIAGMGVRHVRTQPDSRWVYGIVALMFTLGVYLRLLGLGLTPLGFWDTALLILLAYGLFVLHRSFPSRPLMNLAILMPIAALLTVPLQLASPEASLTLMVTGVFYLLVRRDDPRRQLPVYLALLAFNIGIYLWVPGFVEHSQLLQVYVIPVALSILVLLQLHRYDLKQNVLMASRLAALSIIYAAATLDVFLLPDLKIFMLAMGLSVLGLMLGVAMRVRAYLYAGVSFLLLNVAGQFINYYPEEMLGKAIVLMLLGAVIISAMIWFNIKRAEILSQFRSIQDELESWE